jgi:hypothetical protein
MYPEHLPRGEHPWGSILTTVLTGKPLYDPYAGSSPFPYQYSILNLQSSIP